MEPMREPPPPGRLMTERGQGIRGSCVSEDSRLWHVTITVAGASHDAAVVHDALARLAQERQFLHSLRYGPDTAEISYWEEAEGMLDAASLALRVWREHRDTAGLPEWEVVGLEVLERDTFQRRAGSSSGAVVSVADARPRRLQS